MVVSRKGLGMGPLSLVYEVSGLGDFITWFGLAPLIWEAATSVLVDGL